LGREKRRKAKRKRKENDTDTYSLATRRTTRSHSRSATGGHDGPPSSSQSGSRACTQPGGSDMHKRSTRFANKRKQKLGSSSLSGAMLTETAMQHLSKRQKIMDLNTTVMRWVKLTCG